MKLRESVKRESFKSGFTLIELTLAIAFISVLLVTVSLITQEIVKLYRKGYTIKTVNQVGRDLIEDLTSSVTSSTLKAGSICNDFANKDDCLSNGAKKTMYAQKYSDNVVMVKAPGVNTSNVSGPISVPLYGAFCSGQYSYIWNTGYLYGNSYFASASYGADNTLSQKGDSNINSPYAKRKINGNTYKLAKIEDHQNLICKTLFGGSTNYNDTSYPKFPSNFVLADIFAPDPSPEVTELISDSDSPLAIYDLVIFPPAKVDTTGRLFLSGSFILGTVEGGVNVMAQGDYCQLPSGSGYSSFDFSYCAINKFNFSVSTTGTGT